MNIVIPVLKRTLLHKLMNILTKISITSLITIFNHICGRTEFHLFLHFQICTKCIYSRINTFYPNVPFLYPLKKSENRMLSDIFRGYRNGTLGWVHSLSLVNLLRNLQNFLWSILRLRKHLVVAISSFSHDCKSFLWTGSFLLMSYANARGSLTMFGIHVSASCSKMQST